MVAPMSAVKQRREREREREGERERERERERESNMRFLPPKKSKMRCCVLKKYALRKVQWKDGLTNS